MHKIVNGEKVELTTVEIAKEAEKEAVHAQKIVEREATQYQRDRAEAYPSIEDQLDMIYHGSLTSWRAEIKKIKEQFPNPEG